MVFLIKGLELVFLGIMAALDIRERMEPVLLLAAFFLTGLAASAVLYRSLIPPLLYGIWALSASLLGRKALHGGIGTADICVLASLPFWERGEKLLAVYAVSFLLSFAAALFLHRRKKKEELPFLPCVLVAAVVNLIPVR